MGNAAVILTVIADTGQINVCFCSLGIRTERRRMCGSSVKTLVVGRNPACYQFSLHAINRTPGFQTWLPHKM